MSVRQRRSRRQKLDRDESALQTSGQLGANGTEIASLARTAFVNSMSVSLWVAVALAASATIVAIKYLPRHGAHAHTHPTHLEIVDIDSIAVSTAHPAT